MTVPVLGIFTAGQILTSDDMNETGSAVNGLGLFMIKTQTVGNAVATVTVSSAFSADYENYRVIIEGVKSSLGGNLLINFGATTTGYYGSLYYDSYTGASTGALRRNNGANLQCGTAENTLAEQITSMDIGNPFAAASTSLSGTYYGNAFSGWFAGTQASTTSFTSLTIRADGGTLTGGVIRVYGYRNSYS
jgi:hypothetical protein